MFVIIKNIPLKYWEHAAPIEANTNKEKRKNWIINNQ